MLYYDSDRYRNNVRDGTYLEDTFANALTNLQHHGKIAYHLLRLDNGKFDNVTFFKDDTYAMNEDKNHSEKNRTDIGVVKDTYQKKKQLEKRLSKKCVFCTLTVPTLTNNAKVLAERLGIHVIYIGHKINSVCNATRDIIVNELMQIYFPKTSVNITDLITSNIIYSVSICFFNIARFLSSLVNGLSTKILVNFSTFRHTLSMSFYDERYRVAHSRLSHTDNIIN